MKRVVLALLAVAICFYSVACGEETVPKAQYDELLQKYNALLNEQQAPSPTTNTSANSARYGDWELTIMDATTKKDSGDWYIAVHAVYTNYSQNPEYAAACFSVRAFQNDIQMSEYGYIGGIDDNLARAVKNGKSIDVYYFFRLEGDSNVEFFIGTPTASQETLLQKTYTINLQN